MLVSMKFTVISSTIIALMLIPAILTTNAQMESMEVSGTIESEQDPGIGHEAHQLAIILPPSENIYSGTLTYNASEPVQLVALHGPLGEGEDMGQPIWTPDGETKFALTFIDEGLSNGSWNFAGNAIAVHTKNTEPFTVDYTVEYLESPSSELIMSGTMNSIQDPGIGHEGHQIIIVLPPGDDVNSGILAYSASEPIQLVSLNGPLKAGDEIGKAIWTTDGETNYELTFVDPENSMGTWNFSGNALGIHTKNSEQFTSSFSVFAQPMGPGMKDSMQIQDKMMIKNGTKDSMGMKNGTKDSMGMKNGTKDSMGMTKRTVPPIKQIKAGIDPQDITCNEGLDLIFKSHNGKPICVKPFTASVLMERGWAMSNP